MARSEDLKMRKKIVFLVAGILVLMMVYASSHSVSDWFDVISQTPQVGSPHDVTGKAYIPNGTSSQEFVVDGCGDGTVLDTLHNLCWQRNASSWQDHGGAIVGSGLNWTNAMDYCDNLEFGTVADWRLPTINELLTLVRDDSINSITNHLTSLGFVGFTSNSYWTKDLRLSGGQTTHAWFVGFNLGRVLNDDLGVNARAACVSRNT